MTAFRTLASVALVFMFSSVGSAAQITGEYLEARSCNVYTGPCFANAEMDLCGKEAVMAWKVDEGTWNNVSLDGLGAALIVRSEKTMGSDGVFPMKPGRVAAVILVDERATQEQHYALVSFVKDNAPQLAENIVKVQKAPIELKNDHLTGVGTFKAGKLAQIETRALTKDDCVCTNEIIYYQPLNEVENFTPVYSLKMAYQGEGLDSRWNNLNLRSAFQATFRR